MEIQDVLEIMGKQAYMLGMQEKEIAGLRGENTQLKEALDQAEKPPAKTKKAPVEKP
jgi:hypothetical protein